MWYLQIRFCGLSMMILNTANKGKQNKVHYPPKEIQQISLNPAHLLKGASVAQLLRLHFLV